MKKLILGSLLILGMIAFATAESDTNTTKCGSSTPVNGIPSHIRQLKELIHKNLIYQANNLSLKWGGVRLQSHKNSAIS